jgi:putative ABC transport system permease protein
MDWRDYVRHHLRDLTGDPARDADIVEELAQHLAARFDEFRAAGATESEAIDRVATELRNSAEFARAVRRADRLRPASPRPPEAAGTHLITDLPRDASYAVRLLRRTPGFTAAALLTLALGIGMTTAIFSVVQAVLLRPVPFPEPDRLVLMWETDRDSGTTREPASIPDFVDYRQRSRQVDRVGAFVSADVNLVPDRGDPQRLSALAATPDLLQLLGAQTIAGRSFSADEDRPRGPRVAMISDRLWERLFGRDLSAIGKPIRLNGIPVTIVGVVSGTADFGVLQILSAAAYARGFADRDPRTRVDVWVPLQADPANSQRGSNHSFIMIGRLADGATVPSAHDEMVKIAADLERTYPQDNAGRGAFVERLDDVVFGRTRAALSVLMVAVSLVLLISCVNVANLLIARGTSRAREIAVRTALGARLTRLARQFVVENIVLTLGAAALGVPLAYGVLRALVAVGPANIPRLATVSLDGRVLLLALGVSAVIGLVFGILPVAQARRTDVQSALKADGSRGATGRGDGRVVRSTLVVIEVALAVVLVTGAGLLIRSFWNLTRTDPGFDVTGVLKAEFQASAVKYPRGAEAAPHFVAYNRLTNGLLERVRRLPGVESAALAANHPLDTGFTNSFLVVGREAESETWPEISCRFVTPGYFRTLHVPLIRGRVLGESDTSSSDPVVMVNQATVDRFFQTQDPIGQKLRFWGTNWTVVGIVGNERFHGVAKAAPIGAYVPLAQTRLGSLALVVRTTTDPVEMGPAVRGAIREVDPELAIFGLEPLEETVANSLSEQRFLMLLLGLFGALAVTLAGLGVHGVLAYLVAQRTREIGVRMALGATSGRVTHLVVGQGVRLVVVGLAIGFAMALALGRSLAGLLFGVTPTDRLTLVAVLVVVGSTAALSIWLPARRAVRVDPLAALRQE